MYRPQPKQVNRFSSLMPALDYNVVENNKVYMEHVQNPYMGSQFMNTKPIMDEPKELKEAPPTVEPIKPKKKRKTSVEGETVKELTDNIIQDKQNIKLVVKAFKKMAEIVQEEKDNEIFNGE